MHALYVMGVVVAACLLAFTALVAWATLAFIAKHGPLRILHRAATGHHLDGRHRSNRGWLKRGTKPTGADNRAPVTRWARMPRVHRAAAFWAGVLATAWLVIGLASDFGATLLILEVLALLLLAAGIAWLYWRVRTRDHRHHVVTPLATTMSGHLGLAPAVVVSNLSITPFLEQRTAGARIGRLRNIPDSWHGLDGDRDLIEAIISSWLPVALEYVWHLTTHPRWLEMRCAETPPRLVKLSEYLDLIDSLGDNQYFLGVSAGEVPEVLSTEDEDPHMMNCARSRRGKTNTNLAIAAQALRRGEKVTGIDPKRVSLECLRGVPGFTLANNPGDIRGMWTAIHAFREEMDAAIAGEGDGRPHTLILEEINAMFGQFREYWELIKQPGQRITDVPAWRDVKAVLWQGAQFGYKVVVVGQDLTAQVMFGSRSSFGTILATGYTTRQWASIVGTTPVPCSPRQKGRYQLIRGNEATLVQIVCADPRKGYNEAVWREFALAGRVPEADTRTTWRTWRTWRPVPRLALVPGRDPLAVPALPPVLIGYEQAAMYLGITANAFEIRRKRFPIAGEFTDVIQGRKDTRPKPCWHKDTLDMWVAENGWRSKTGVSNGGQDD